MRRTVVRARAAVVVAALAIGALPTSLGPAAAASRGGDPDPTPLTEARRRLGPALVTGRGSDGDLHLLGARAGRHLAIPASAASGSEAVIARDYARRFGVALGLRDSHGLRMSGRTEAARDQPVVRFQQSVGGLPVVGGELAIALDHRDNLTAISGETTDVTTTDRPASVSSAEAAEVALAASARAHATHETLRAQPPELWFYDPRLLGAVDPFGPRPVWRMEVGDGLGVRDLVLVDAATGRVALRADQVPGVDNAPALDRVVCDRANVSFAGTGVAVCRSGYARTEAGAPSDQPEAEAAFAHAGATADLFADVAGIDLTQMIGHDSGDGRKLRSTVRVCVNGEPCPWSNAFWNGVGMYYGDGFAAADDVVGHELTHGVVERTAGLFYWYQSGAINESFADVFGEILDLRYGSDTVDRPWQIGEDAPTGALRDMADPGAYGQPGRMTSAAYAGDPYLWDQGGVHTNSGVGNKAAYLIAEGGTFNGRTVTGLDASDPRKTKTAAIYWAALQMLTSAADYADLYSVLPQACRDLAAEGTAGLVPADCAQVVAAVTATEMDRQPTTADTQAPEAPECPEPSLVTPVFREDFEGPDNSWSAAGALWSMTPNDYLPAYATSGTHSYFAWDPDPAAYGDEPDGWLRSPWVQVPADGRTFLRFDHAYVFEWDPSTRTYVDGGRVEYSLDGSTWHGTADLPWVNGPGETLTLGAAPDVTGFGGDSHGYASSRLDLTSLAGRSVRLRWRVTGDAAGSSGWGWWLDDISVHTCRTLAAGAPQHSQVDAGRGTLNVTWDPPAWPGTGVSGYRVTARPGGHRVDVGADARAATLRGLASGTTYEVRVQAVNGGGLLGVPTVHVVAGTRLTIARPAHPVVYRGPARIRGRLTRVDTGAALVGNIVRVFARPAAGGPWAYVGYTGTSDTGRYSLRVTPSEHLVYVARYRGLTSRLGSSSPRSGRVRVRPRITARLGYAAVDRGERARMVGFVRPAMTGEPIVLQRRVGTRWRAVRSMRLQGVGYQFPLPTGRRGVFDYRIVKPRDALRLAGSGPVRRFRVR